MKEKLYTIELTDALKSGDECPLCYLYRNLEQTAIEFILGSSYMESDIREQTDRHGFCQKHTKMMFDYGNTLGNAWILKTRLEYLRKGLREQTENYAPQKKTVFAPQKISVFARRRKDNAGDSSIGSWIRGAESSCYVCDRIQETCDRVVDTFVYQVKHDKEFVDLVMKSKGFCIHHFADLIDGCEKGLDQKEKETLFPLLFQQMEQELGRIQEDIDWLIEKFDYRNADKDWKNSKDAVPRTMQKITGGYPADPPFKNQK